MPLDFESVAAAGSMLGTRALQIFDETTCVVRAVLRWTEFYEHESCGKCTPCREGTFWMVQVLERLEHGQGTEEDLEKLLDICDNILGRAFCALGDGATSPITSGIQYFRDEFMQHQKDGGCPFDPAASTLWASGSHEHDGRDDAGHGRRHHRRVRDQGAQGHAGHQGGRDARHPDPAVLRPPAARPDRRLPPVPGRRGGPAQAAGLVHHRRAPRAWWCTPSSPPRWPRRRSGA